MDDADRLDDRPRRPDHRPWRARESTQGDGAHAAAVRLRLPPRARPDGPLRPRHGPPRAGLRAGVRLRPPRRRPGAGPAPSTASPTPATARRTLRLHSDVNIGIEGGCARARRRLDAGEGCFFALSWSLPPRRPGQLRGRRGRARHDLAVLARRGLPPATSPTIAGSEHLQRSALVLKGLTYMPDRRDGRGADDVAAGDARRRAQLGLPLHVDARCDLHAPGPARARPRAGRPTTSSSSSPTSSATRTAACRSCTGSAARRACEEQELDHLTGYEGARPVRIGNDAFDQRQNDVYGAVLDSIYLHQKEYGHNSPRLWPVIEDQARCAAEVWRRPDQGIWEMRGEPQHYVSSKVMCWVAARPRRAARRPARLRGPRRRVAAGRQRDPRRRPRATASTRAASSPSTTTPTRLDASNLLRAAGPLPAAGRRAGPRHGPRHRRRADRERPRPPLPDRRDRRRPRAARRARS